MASLKEIGVATAYSGRHREDASHLAGEQQYRALADAMPQIVYTTKPDGKLDYYNRRWFDYTGTTLDETQGRGWEMLLHPDDFPKVPGKWTEALRTGETFETEYRFKRASDGVYREVSALETGILDDNLRGTLIYF